MLLYPSEFQSMCALALCIKSWLYFLGGPCVRDLNIPLSLWYAKILFKLHTIFWLWSNVFSLSLHLYFLRVSNTSFALFPCFFPTIGLKYCICFESHFLPQIGFGEAKNSVHYYCQPFKLIKQYSTGYNKG